MCLTLGWIFIYVHSTSSRYLEMMACFECSQTFKMFYFHPWGGTQGWVERKHMMAIFHGTRWLTFPECTCLFGFYSIASREREKDTVSSLFRRLGWEMVSHQRFVLVGMTLGSVLCHRNHHCYKGTSLDPKGSGSYNKHQGSAQLHLLSWAFVVSDIAGDQPSDGTLGFISSAICCRDFT